ncbi:T6SS immunity protein Tli4 family protein, partial [Paludibacterium purpuratum]
MNPRIVYLLGLTLTWLAPTLYAAEPVMFDKTKTYCFGRYLVDIPVEAELKGQGNTYQGARIASEKMGTAALQARIDQKIKDLKARTYAASYYQFNKEIKLEKNGTILLGYDDPFNTPMYSIDTFKWDWGWAFTTSKGAYDDQQIDSLVSRFSTYLRSLRYRDQRDIPTEPGICIKNGFIANDGKTPQAENASLAFQLKKNPDVWIRIESNVLFRSQPSL